MIPTQEDKKIISYLRKNARTSLVAISQNTGIAQSTLYEKLKSYKQSFIKKHTTLFDFKKLGYNVEVKIAVKAKKESKESLLAFVKLHRNVNSAFHINSGYDFFLECIFENYSEMFQFISKLEQEYGVEKTELYQILHDIKQEEFLSN
ncbi:winged helix-turn-helix transcriptional regulator [Candidatus Woesearchaeota archaeon]|nr:winged helix-turn-helix transcriptional regulator [Candidatus Woesearchaeota archaeon]